MGIGSYPAAQACVNDTSGGKTDWFLPSKDETQKIIDNMTEFYPLYITWTSSEWSGSPIDCLWKYNGVIGAYTKSGTGYVVPVRSY